MGQRPWVTRCIAGLQDWKLGQAHNSQSKKWFVSIEQEEGTGQSTDRITPPAFVAGNPRHGPMGTRTVGHCGRQQRTQWAPHFLRTSILNSMESQGPVISWVGLGWVGWGHGNPLAASLVQNFFPASCLLSFNALTFPTVNLLHSSVCLSKSFPDDLTHTITQTLKVNCL